MKDMTLLIITFSIATIITLIFYKLLEFIVNIIEKKVKYGKYRRTSKK